MTHPNPDRHPSPKPDDDAPPLHRELDRSQTPLLNYTLATVCPACGTTTFRHACKVRCTRCGFMWDCSEL